MRYNSDGSIRVKAYTASGALPIEGVTVKIYGTDENNKDVKYSLITDNDGITKELAVPAPDRNLSISPGANESPYSVYTVELAKKGFYPKRIDGVPIFAKTKAFLPIEMIPEVYNELGNIIKQDNLNSIIYENENL